MPLSGDFSVEFLQHERSGSDVPRPAIFAPAAQADILLALTDAFARPPVPVCPPLPADADTSRNAEMTAFAAAPSRQPEARFASQAAAVSRRSVLQLGAGAALGLSLPAMLLRAETAGARLAARPGEPGRKPIRSCIFVYFYGGPSHIDSWDMKPMAPREIRGEFAPIATTAPTRSSWAASARAAVPPTP